MALLLLVASFFGISLSSCSNSPDHIAPTSPIIYPHSAHIDEKSGQIDLPIDSFGPSRTENRELDFARQILEARCLNLRTSPVIIDVRSEPFEVSRRYGVWTEDVARQYAYIVPSRSPKIDHLNRWRSRNLSSSEAKALMNCRTSSDYQHLAVASSDYQMINFASYEDVLKTPEGRTVISEWHQCLDSYKIIHRNDRESLWIPPSAETMRNPQTISIALRDVECKRKTHLVHRLAALESAWQIREIEHNLILLTKQRKAVEDSLSAARRIIRTHEDSHG